MCWALTFVAVSQIFGAPELFNEPHNCKEHIYERAVSRRLTGDMMVPERLDQRCAF